MTARIGRERVTVGPSLAGERAASAAPERAEGRYGVAGGGGGGAGGRSPPGGGRGRLRRPKRGRGGVGGGGGGGEGGRVPFPRPPGGGFAPRPANPPPHPPPGGAPPPGGPPPMTPTQTV